MKFSVSILALILCTASFAKTNNFVKVTAEEGRLITEAISTDLKSSNLQCKFTNNNNKPIALERIAEILDNAVLAGVGTGVYVNESDSQPVIKLTAFSQNFGNQESYVTTSHDFRTVVKIELTEFRIESQRINEGTIVNPVFVDKEVRTVNAIVLCE
jgi:hypothetical protein